ncbi:MAG: pilus assembly protein TadB [Actinobacteria bacterium]|nr:pilus assembly protein TadB [Actinomycetota bacterium]
MTALVGLLGGLFGLGAVIAVSAWRGVDVAELRPRRLVRAEDQIERLGLRLAAGVGSGVLVAALTRWPVAALAAAAGGFVLPGLVGRKADRRSRIEKVEAIAGWAEMLRDTMAGAGGLEQSIVASAGVAPPAIRREVLTLAARLQRERLAPALRDFADELDDPTGDLVVAALLLAADKSPKRLGQLLGTLAESARAEVTMRLRIDAGRARTRTSVRVVTFTTVGFAVLLLVLNRSYLQPYDSAVGQLVLAVVAGCFATAFWWLARSSRVDADERFLAEAGRASA